ncbi:hypothetical protein [uncultured Thiocystis sp.]|jgi:hypothetical protein|uniref:hypothetical protein n=1 Tax=uncultured Thiocystis sp. TaxID=1202134 RepID=UPI0025EDD8D5|nr:hypothetical protein [uncultured Thiocystis sp.]
MAALLGLALARWPKMHLGPDPPQGIEKKHRSSSAKRNLKAATLADCLDWTVLV